LDIDAPGFQGVIGGVAVPQQGDDTAAGTQVAGNGLGEGEAAAPLCEV